MLANIFSIGILQTALEIGFVYGLIAIALFISYSMLGIADLSTDGCFTLGCAVGCQVAILGMPILGLLVAMVAGVGSGFITSFLQTRLGVESIMAGIIVNTGLYTINLAFMGFSSTLNLVKQDTIFTLFKDTFGEMGGWSDLVLGAIIVCFVGVLVLFFFKTHLGLSIRATGDNKDMVRASSINPATTITVGLCISGALTALSGAIIAQYQKSMDINIGTGMVTIALASLIIGETIFGKKKLSVRIFAAIVGSCIYRIIIAISLRFNMPASSLKLISALIVAIAIASPAVRAKFALYKTRRAAKLTALKGE